MAMLTIPDSRTPFADCDPTQLFRTSAVVATGPGPQAVAIGDFNGDGIPDVAVAVMDASHAGARGRIQVFFGHGSGGIGDGTFSSPTDLAAGAEPSAIVCGDFNDDHILDLAVANFTGNTVSVLLGRGSGGLADGTFQPAVSQSVGSGPCGIVAADFNHDGALDLAVTNRSDGTVSVLLGTGDGSFAGALSTQMSFASGTAPVAVAAADLNGDGNQDLAVCLYGSNTVTLLVGNGNGTFSGSGSTSAFTHPLGLAVGDVNGDGAADVAVATNGRQALGVVIGNGQGRCQPIQYYPAPHEPTAVCLGDFDGDGVLDAAVTDGGSNSVTVLHGFATGTIPDGSFGAIMPTPYGVGSNPVAIATADLNGDGRPDLVVVDQLSNDVTVLLGGCAQIPPVQHVANWYAGGTRICIASDDQSALSLAPDGVGGMYAAWCDPRWNPYNDIYATHLTVSGALVTGWHSNGTAMPVAGGYHLAPTIVPDGAQGFILVFNDADLQCHGQFNCDPVSPEYRAVRIGPQGTVVPGWPLGGLRLRAPQPQDNHEAAPAAISDGSGGVIAVWEDQRNLNVSDQDIYAQRVTGAGTIAAGWPVDGIAVCGSVGSQGTPTLGADGTGGMIVSWVDRSSPAGPAIFAQHITSAGQVAPGWPAGGLVLTSSYAFGQVLPRGVFPDGSGGAFIAWQAGNTSSTLHLLVQRVTSSGAVAPGWPAGGLAIAATNLSVSCMADVSGNFFAAWTQPNGSQGDIFALRLNGDGQPSAGWATGGISVCTLPGNQQYPALISDGAGGVIVSWADDRNNPTGDYTLQLNQIYAVHLTGTGAFAPGNAANGEVLSASGNTFGGPGAINPMNVSDGAGGAFVLWQDYRYFNYDLFGQHVAGDGPVPVTASFIAAAATPNQVEVVWWLGEEIGGLRVERRTESSDWTNLGVPSQDGPQRVRYTDITVSQGTRYAYRLVSGGTPLSQETWVDVPMARFALRSLSPNPIQGVPRIALSLLNSAPARLELLDTAGRLVASKSVGALGAGDHVVDLDEARDVPAGVYWIRLAQGANVRTARGVVIR